MPLVGLMGIGRALANAVRGEAVLLRHPLSVTHRPEYEPSRVSTLTRVPLPQPGIM